MAKPLLLGRKEIASIYNISPTSVSDSWVPHGILSYDDAVIVSGKPFWPGGFIESVALPPGKYGRQLDVGKLEALEAEQGASVRPMKKGELPPLVGAQEYASLFGVTQIAVSQAKGRLPASDYYLSGSHVWLLSTVLAAAEETMAGSRKGLWRLNEDVAEALRTGTYDGPGSSFAKRGLAAKK
ncbi:hypothetical protein ACFYVL_17170 [Streptomyces sp. NPDC004111]|uniref:hypothetical protein n=1 Tax=Streptomyces sp. NPDC004111 TaxID=3364690 RepID=UPI0036B3BECE